MVSSFSAPNLSDVSPYVGVRWQIYGRVTGALRNKSDNVVVTLQFVSNNLFIIVETLS